MAKFSSLDEIKVKLEDLVQQDKSVQNLNLEALLHEVDTYQYQLEIQNQELGKIHRELENSKEKYFELYNNAPIGYLTFDKDFNILDINLSGSALLGGNRIELIGKPFKEFICKDFIDKFNAYKKRLISSNKKESCELGIQTNESGPLSFIKINSSKFYIVEKEPIIIRSIIEDITEKKKSEIELIESEKRFRDLVELLPLAVYELDKEGYIMFVNRMGLEMYGITRNQVENGLNAYDFLDKENSQKHKKLCERLLGGERITGNEFTVKRYDGTTFPAIVRATPVFRDDVHIGWRGITVDISEQKNIQMKLRDSEELYSMLIENAFDAIYLMKGRRYEYVNPRFCQLTGYSENELTSPNFDFNLLLPNELKETINTRYEAHKRKDDITNQYETQILNKNGNLIDVEISTVSMGSTGNVVVLGIMRDISERKRAEEIIKLEREQLLSIFDSLEQVIYIADMDNHEILYANPYTRKTFSNQLIGKKCHEVINGKNRPCDFCTNEIIRKLNGKPYRWEYFNPIASKYYDIVDKTIKWTDGRYVRLEVAFDITDRKTAEEKIRTLNFELEDRVAERTSQLEDALEELRYENEERKRTQEELEKAKDELESIVVKERELNDLKTNFISMVSHEYRTPLTVILSSTYVIEQLFDVRDKDTFNKHLNRIQISVKTMNQLLENLLIIGRSDSGKLEINLQEVNLNEFLQNMIDIMKTIDKNEHVFQYFYQEPDININSDPKLLNQVFQNLLSNAMKYSPKDSLIKLELSDLQNYYQIKVTDSGIGIPKEEKEHLFIPFHRFSNVGNITGTGLGLAIVKRCTESLNGSISVESELNNGTSFIINLPKDLNFPN